MQLHIATVRNVQRLKIIIVSESGKLILEKVKVKDSFIVDTAGISSMYANDGGIIVVL